MLYYLFKYLHELNLPGTGVFEYISFRAACALITSLVISMIIGKKIIQKLQILQVGEIVRDLGLQGQIEKQGTPTMGGIIILASILIPTILFAKLDNIYIILMIVSTIMLGTIGFVDDYIKVFKKNKEGLAGKFKIMGQVAVGIVVGTVLYFNQNVVVKQKIIDANAPAHISYRIENNVEHKVVENYTWKEVKSTVTTIPFMKNNEFDYASLTSWAGKYSYLFGGIIFILIVIIIITAVSNGANMTDGLDGLATGTSAIIGVTLAIFAYVSGNTVFAEYLNIMYIPKSGELVIFIAAFVGACVGFLWYNSYPAQVFMGDTGSLALGGIIAVFAIAIRKELLIPLLCGIFLAENLSVIVQVGYFKYTKKRYGEGKRVLLMAPLHHHYQKKNMHEAKIVARFWIIGIMLALVTFVTLKLR